MAGHLAFVVDAVEHLPAHFPAGVGRQTAVDHFRTLPAEALRHFLLLARLALAGVAVPLALVLVAVEDALALLPALERQSLLAALHRTLRLAALARHQRPLVLARPALPAMTNLRTRVRTVRPPLLRADLPA